MDINIVGCRLRHVLQCFARLFSLPQAKCGRGTQGVQRGGVGGGVRRGRQFIQYALVFALPEQGASDHGIDGACRKPGLTGPSKFLFGAGQIELGEVELPKLKTRIGIFIIFGHGILELDHRRLVVTCSQLCLGVRYQRCAIFSATSG